jgi:glycine betaine/proline transport system substrate-binding protein
MAYGVGAVFEPIEVSSEAELNGLISRSYQQGEPFVTYYWDPSPLLGQLDMTLLQEPAYTEDCWDKVEAAVTDYEPGNVSEEACAYETVPIRKFATDDFVSEHPDVADMLERMMVGTATVRELAGYMTSNEVSPEETAAYFFENYPQVWSAWLSDQQVMKVELALRDAR